MSDGARHHLRLLADEAQNGQQVIIDAARAGDLEPKTILTFSEQRSQYLIAEALAVGFVGLMDEVKALRLEIAASALR